MASRLQPQLRMGGLILKYRADIDGLRAIAVLSVLAFHYNAALPGGFTGVDVFFVISGFLITQQLSAEISNGTFSILNFYDRRIRRIVPALAVVLAFSLWIGKFLLLPGDYKSMAASAAYAALGASNFFFLSNTGYFDQGFRLDAAPSHLVPRRRGAILSGVGPCSWLFSQLAERGST